MDKKERRRNNKAFKKGNEKEGDKITHEERRNERRRNEEGEGRTKME